MQKLIILILGLVLLRHASVSALECHVCKTPKDAEKDCAAKETCESPKDRCFTTPETGKVTEMGCEAVADCTGKKCCDTELCNKAPAEATSTSGAVSSVLEDHKSFKKMLRMTSEEFEILLERVAPLITKQDTKMRRAITARERLSVTINFLATGALYESLAFYYRLGATTISKIVKETCHALHQVLKGEFLKTPTSEEEWRAVANDFYAKWQFPHCLGALDGKHISIQSPANSGSTWHNYKDMLPNSDVVLPYMFVGDEAYPLRTDLMKPYPYKQLDHHQRIYNYRLSRARRIVENAFGILANRFRVFRSTILLHPDTVVKMTLAAACLHNFLRDRRSVVYVPPALVDWEGADHRVNEGTWRRDGLGAMQNVQAARARNPNLTAKEQRQLLKEYFMSPAGQVSWQEDRI